MIIVGEKEGGGKKGGRLRDRDRGKEFATLIKFQLLLK